MSTDVFIYEDGARVDGPINACLGDSVVIRDGTGRTFVTFTFRDGALDVFVSSDGTRAAFKRAWNSLARVQGLNP